MRFRDGDIVISAPSKSGTTWVQMMCALLVFQTTTLPDRLAELSPWLDMRLRPPGAVCDHLETQQHRRFMKTHTPLDGIPVHENVTYVVVGRDPREVAVSLYHQRHNLKAELLEAGRRRGVEELGPHESIKAWLESNESPQRNLVTLKGLVWHLTDAWSRRAQPNVVLLHYRNLSDDLDAQMRTLADHLRIDIDESTWPTLVEAATFQQMRGRAAQLAPDPDILGDATRFFRTGLSGDWSTWFTGTMRSDYNTRIAGLAEPELIRWLHHGTDLL